MRFAYIDSQGNEVPIPSVDALALRIELGAVGPDTQLYDAHADHWGPAHTHEIFHSLSRDAQDEGFVPPPPPMSSGPPVASAPEPTVPAGEADFEPAEAHAADQEEEPEGPEGDQEERDEEAASDFGLTLADPPPDQPDWPSEEPDEDKALGDLAMEEAAAKEEAAAMDLPLLEDPAEPARADASSREPEEDEELRADEPLPLLEDTTLEARADEPPEESELEEPDEVEEGGFDFGDLGGGLDLEDSTAAADMAVETEMEFQSPPEGFGSAEALQLEEPMSAFQPDSPPDWMDEPATDEVMDFSAVAESDVGVEPVAPVAEAPTRQRRTPKDRPSPPKFRSQRSMLAPVLLVVLLLVVGVGGYYAWPIVSGSLAGGEGSEPVPVVMPDLPAELVPQLRAIGGEAIAAVVAEVDASTRAAGAPAGPDDDWLAGVYLGNASRYPGIEAFWSGMDAFTGGLRAADWQLYHDKYVEGATAAGLESGVAAQLTERADSGFVAAQEARAQAYADLERLVAAALELHDFLLDNEADIVFRPGVTSATDPSVDPVLEIQAPDDDREQMLGMFDEITEALDALGSLDRVTRERLVAAMTARLQEVGLQ